MKNLIHIILFSILLLSCNFNSGSEQIDSIDDSEKRNENWVWFVDTETKIGEWIPVGDENPVQNGEYTLFYYNGIIRQKGKIKNGIDCDTIYYFNLEGQVIRKSITLNDSLYSYYTDGKYKNYTASGILHEVGEKKDNKDNGLYTQYYTNGNKSQEYFSILGLIEGKAFWWYEDGKIEAIELYKNGVVDGIAEKYFPNGNKQWNINYSNGKKNGLAEYWYENGIRKSSLSWKNGNPEGIYITWFENGNINYQIEYKNGLRNGHAAYFYESGNKEKEGNFKNDEKIGVWKEWDEEGNLINEENF